MAREEEIPEVKSTPKWKRFAENVSVAGLLELYHCSTPLSRFLWTSVLLCSASSIAYHTWQLTLAYMNQGPTFDVIPTSNLTIPFPDVTICTTVDMNRSRALERIVLPERVRKKLESKSQAERNEFLNAVTLHMSTSMESLRDSTFSSKYMNPFLGDMRDTVAASLDGLLATFGDNQLIFSGCGNLMIKCTFNGHPYDCCEIATFKMSEGSLCYEIPTQSMDAFSGQVRHPTYPTKLEVDLHFNWKDALFFSNDATDGFYLHISDPVSLFNQPVALPGGMHATVKISKAIKRADLTGCLDNKKVPLLDTGPYDGRGYNCKLQMFQEKVTMKYLGCKVPFGSYVPDLREMCNGAQALALKHFAARGCMSKEEEKQIRQDMRSAFYNDYCLPKCNQWEYEANPSYSALMKATEAPEDANVTRTRVTVVLPSAFYEERTEKEFAPFYSTFVDICYTFGLYAGVSVISFAEIVFYSLEVCCKKLIEKNLK